jgi:hypothetical protein
MLISVNFVLSKALLTCLLHEVLYPNLFYPQAVTENPELLFEKSAVFGFCISLGKTQLKNGGLYVISLSKFLDRVLLHLFYRTT